METKLLYLTDPTCLNSVGSVIETGTDNLGFYVVLSATSAYVQGGGQEGDMGYMIVGRTEFAFTSVKRINDQVRHYLNTQEAYISQGTIASVYVNENNRLANTVLHTGGHLVASIVFATQPGLNPIKGHHFKSGSYIEFDANNFTLSESEKLNFVAQLQLDIDNDIRTGLTVTTQTMPYSEFSRRTLIRQIGIPNHEIIRTVEIDGYFPMACGGTHLATLKGISELTISGIKLSKDILRVSYKCIEG